MMTEKEVLEYIIRKGNCTSLWCVENERSENNPELFPESRHCCYGKGNTTCYFKRKYDKFPNMTIAKKEYVRIKIEELKEIL